MIKAKSKQKPGRIITMRNTYYLFRCHATMVTNINLNIRDKSTTGKTMIKTDIKSVPRKQIAGRQSVIEIL